MEKVVFICGILTIVFVILIFGFLFKEGFSFFKEYGVFNFLTGKLWYPTSNPAMYGVLSLIVGSLLVTLGAIAIAVPLGIMAALYIAEIAPAWKRYILKSGVELMAAIPSVGIGFVGMVTLVPLVRTLFDIPTGLTAVFRVNNACFYGYAYDSFNFGGRYKVGSVVL
jgi:phosphate transport system permease protein